MNRWLRWLAIAPLVLILLALVVVQTLRASAVGDAEREALALLEVPPPPVQGRNGFAALYLADYDVPEGQLEAAMAEEVAVFQRWQQHGAPDSGEIPHRDGNDTSPPQQKQTGSRWVEKPKLKFGDDDCTSSDSRCLDKVSLAPDVARTLLEREADRLARVDMALAADHFRSPYPDAFAGPLPSYQLLRLSLTRAALDAVDGRVTEAALRSCRLLAASRRFSVTATDLLASSVFAATAEGAANLLLELQRAHPGMVLPDECGPALVPVRNDDYWVCEGMRGEFRGNRELARHMDASYAGWHPRDLIARHYLVDGSLMAAWIAPVFAHFCTDSYREQLRAGIVAKMDYLPIKGTDPGCFAAYVSCVLARVTMGSFDFRQVSQLDRAARLRLALASIGLAQGSLTREQALAQAESPGYPLAVDVATGTASIQTRRPANRRGDTEYRVPFGQ